MRRFILAAIFLASNAAGLRAQDGKTYSYSTSARTQSAQEIEDIGEIDEKEGFSSLRQKFRFSVTTRGEYTSNAKLSGNHSSSDFLFLPTVEVGFHTPLGKHFSFDLSTKVESVIYSRFDERGFVGYSALATLDYRFKAGLPRIYASVEPYRYDSFDTGELATEAVGFTGGTDWGFAFNKGRSLGFVGYSFTGYIADPNKDTRNVHRAVAGIAHQFSPKLTGQAYYIYQHSDYTDFGRDDSRHAIVGSLIYQFSSSLFGSATANFVDNDSTQDRASYQGVGGSFGLTLQF